MRVGTDLLVKLFEVLDKNNSKEKITRRLYCESGNPATKAYRFVNDSTKARLEQIILKCQDCRHDKLRHATMVLVFEELANLKELQLLKGCISSLEVLQKRHTSYAMPEHKVQLTNWDCSKVRITSEV